MSKRKRSVIEPERRLLLSDPQAVYLITCYDQEYFCDDHSNGCWRGFFSLYTQVVYGIYFANRLKIPFYVDFGNLHYRYSDPAKFNGDLNFWNYYFLQRPLSESVKTIPNIRYENYPLRVWSRRFLRKLNESVREYIILKSDIKQSIDSLKEKYHRERILGIHIRRTDHAIEVKPASDISYFNAIDRHINKFDKLYLATDDQNTLKECEKRYPGKIIYQDVVRSSGNTSIHHMETEDKYLLGKQALQDCYMLASCSKVILSPSNLSYAVLLINPELDYELIESQSARWTRWKTLIVYYLDRLNIRKW